MNDLDKGNAYYQEKQYEFAIMYYNKMLEEDPKNL